MIRWRTIFFCLFLLLICCNRGLQPTEEESLLPLTFPIPPQGGDPTGYWVPASQNPVEVTIINPEKIPSVVDSLRLDSQLSGFFIINRNKTYNIDAQLQVVATAYISIFPDPVIVPVCDTLRARGMYETIQDRVIIFDFGQTTFKLDTLGVTTTRDSLSLISLSNSFPLFPEINFYFVFHLVRATWKAFNSHLGRDDHEKIATAYFYTIGSRR